VAQQHAVEFPLMYGFAAACPADGLALVIWKTERSNAQGLQDALTAAPRCTSEFTGILGSDVVVADTISDRIGLIYGHTGRLRY
jgi:hypothetical protein